MATKNKPCLLASDGCKAFAWKQGYCWKHHPDHVANKAAACADKQAIRDIHKAAEIPLPCNDVLVAEEWQVIECEPPPPVTGCEIHIINLLQVFRQQREAQLEQELAELDGDLKALAEPYDKMILVLDRMRS